MLKDLTYQETSDELNKRGYYPEPEGVYVPEIPKTDVLEPVYVPEIPETVSLSPKPVPEPVPFLERYGKLVVFGVIGAFLIAIYPGQEG